MAEDMGDKTEAPTPQRRQKAREQGNVPRSQDLTAAMLLLGAVLLLNMTGMGLIQALQNIMGALLGPESLGSLDASGLFTLVLAVIATIGRAMAPLLVGLCLLAIVANILQVGFFASAKRLQPNLGALHPTRGLKRIFGEGNGAMKLLINLLKLCIVGYVAYASVRDQMGLIVNIQQYGFLQIFAISGNVLYKLALKLGVVLLVLALIDYAWQRYRHEKRLKMSKQEVKEEMKRMDGDPQVKARRREIARQMALQRARQDVPSADVVVTNPTHFAVALKYDADSMTAPKVVAKGADYMAMRIREIAVAHGIPILERPPLARALYRLVDVGQEIPEQFYSAVAEILAYVYELTGKTREVVRS